MLILNLKTAKHSQHIPLSAKSWYQLLTTALFILRNLETINKPFMWQQNVMVKMKTETTLTFETLDFIH